MHAHQRQLTELRSRRRPLAPQAGELRKLKDLLASGEISARTISQADSKGRSALHHAAAAGHLGVVASLLSRSANVNAADPSGATPLRLARQGERAPTGPHPRP